LRRFKTVASFISFLLKPDVQFRPRTGLDRSDTWDSVENVKRVEVRVEGTAVLSLLSHSPLVPHFVPFL
jgi:hypothetical protein